MFADYNKLETLNDWLYWMKENYLVKSGAVYVDKYLAKSYVEKVVGKDFVIPTIDVLHSVDNLNCLIYNYEYPLIIKPTHDCGGGIVLEEARQLNSSEISRLKQRLSYNYGILTLEEIYTRVEPKLIVEKLLVDSRGAIPDDYKFVCIGGRVEFIYLSYQRHSKNVRMIYDRLGHPMAGKFIKKYGKHTHKFSQQMELPLDEETLRRAIDVSEKLAMNFPFIRVDLYIFDKKIYVGELTFVFGGGNDEFLPLSWNKELGSRLKVENFEGYC